MSKRLFLTVMLFAFAAMAFHQTHVFAEDEPAKRTVSVKCDAPATNYKIEIESVWRIGEELWVVSKITKIGDIGGAAITPLKDSVKVAADEDLKVKHYISGKSWNWWNGVDCEFIDSRAALLKKMKKDKTKIDEVLHGDDPEAPDDAA